MKTLLLVPAFMISCLIALCLFRQWRDSENAMYTVTTLRLGPDLMWAEPRLPYLRGPAARSASSRPVPITGKARRTIESDVFQQTGKHVTSMHVSDDGLSCLVVLK